MLFRHGSSALDSSSPTARSGLVILSEAKDLAASRDRPFAEFPLSEAKGSEPALERSEGVTRGDCSNGQG